MIRADYEGVENLVSNPDTDYESEVYIPLGMICISTHVDGYNDFFNSTDFKNWEQVKEFVDNKIINSMGLTKELLGEQND